MARLRSELEGTGGLRAGPGLEEGVWRVCADYKLMEPPDREPHIVPAYPVEHADGWKTVRPLSDKEYAGLFVELARTFEDCLEYPASWTLEQRNEKRRDYLQPIMRFLRKYGLLGLAPRPGAWAGGRSETVQGYISEMGRAADILYLYETVLDGDEERAATLLEDYPCQVIDGERLDERGTWYEMGPLEHALIEVSIAVTERVNELCRVSIMPPKRSADISRIGTGWTFDSLLGAAYLQMYWHIAAQGKVSRCKQCGGLFQSKSAKREFCPERDGVKDKCKADWNYHHGGGTSNKTARMKRRSTAKADTT